MLKTAQYLPKGTVVYAIVGRCCYFSGLGPPYKVCSTINAAEDIILAITSQERRRVTGLRFFDLQTHRGYAKLPPGIYELDELIVKMQKPLRAEQGVLVIGWRPIHVEHFIPAECPPKVLELFREYIGEIDPAVKIWTPDEAERAGYAPTEFHAPNPGRCFEISGLQDESLRLGRQLTPQVIAIAERMLGSSFLDRMAQIVIVVDYKGYSEYLKMSEGDRYAVWSRNIASDS